ncbi:hypothetical protein ABZ354_22890 [Streptomyces sp. NPDC005925]|uniref:hypothetical protein n=1 Tax=Streptomyces sp. NPDC005925 TaxID=3157172 RepID=UPI0033E6DDF0
MSRSPAVRVLTGPVLATAVLLGVAGCGIAGGGRAASGSSRAPVVSSAPPDAERPPVARATPAMPPVLTEGQARAALVTRDDLGGPWVPTRGAATWRDALLKATTGDADCRRLLDVLYADDLFGAPGGPRAVVALDDVDTDAQLRHQVTAYRAAELDRTLHWMRTLPKRCGRFAASTAVGERAEIRVTDEALPEAGDARQGLRVTLTGTDTDGGAAVLTLEVAAVRVGEDAISVTNGGLGEVVPDITRAVAELGAQRLAEVRAQGRAQV